MALPCSDRGGCTGCTTAEYTELAGSGGWDSKGSLPLQPLQSRTSFWVGLKVIHHDSGPQTVTK